MKRLSVFGSPLTRLAAAATLACIGVIGVSIGADQKRARPMSHDEVAQVWIGLSEDESYAYRLVLSPNGTGRGAYVFADQAAHLFQLESWTYDSKRIAMVVSPTDSANRGIQTLNGTIVGIAMELTVAGDGWSQEVRLRPERDLQTKWEKLRESESGIGR